MVSAANPAIVFRKRAGDPESSTLNVAANANGELEFEVCFKAPVIRNNPPYPSTGVAFSDPKSGDKFYDELENVYGWRGPTMPVTFCDVFGKPLSVPWNPDANTYIVRPTGWENAAWFLVERRRKGSSEGFHGWPVSPPEKETEIFFSLEWVEEGSQRTDYDWQITSFLKVPAPNSPPPARSPR